MSTKMIHQQAFSNNMILDSCLLVNQEGKAGTKDQRNKCLEVRSALRELTVIKTDAGEWMAKIMCRSCFTSKKSIQH